MRTSCTVLSSLMLQMDHSKLQDTPSHQQTACEGSKHAAEAAEQAHKWLTQQEVRMGPVGPLPPSLCGLFGNLWPAGTRNKILGLVRPEPHRSTCTADIAAFIRVWRSHPLQLIHLHSSGSQLHCVAGPF